MQESGDEQIQEDNWPLIFSYMQLPAFISICFLNDLHFIFA